MNDSILTLERRGAVDFGAIMVGTGHHVHKKPRRRILLEKTCIHRVYLRKLVYVGTANVMLRDGD